MSVHARVPQAPPPGLRRTPVLQPLRAAVPSGAVEVGHVYLIHPGALPSSAYTSGLVQEFEPSVGVSVLDLASLPDYWGALDGHRPARLEDLVEQLWSELRTHQEAQPCRFTLVGWSFGGVIGFELSRRARSLSGFRGLVLLDSVAPIRKYKQRDDALDRKMLMRWFVMYLSARRGKVIPERLPFGPRADDELLAHVLKHAVASGALAEDTPIEGMHKLHQAFLAGLLRNNQLSGAYRPAPLDIPAVLIKARRSLVPLGRHMGWKELLRPAPLRVSCPGDHYTLLTNRTASRTVAEAARDMWREPKKAAPAEALGGTLREANRLP